MSQNGNKRLTDGNWYAGPDTLTVPLELHRGAKHFQANQCRRGRVLVSAGRLFSIANSSDDLFFGDDADRRACDSKAVPFQPVPFEFIDQVWAVMALCPDIDFLVMTKRPGRMAEYLNDRGSLGHNIYQLVSEWLDEGEAGILGGEWDRVHDLAGRSCTGGRHNFTAWTTPLMNVWLGTSVEDQQAADERIPELLRCPAAVRFLSCEPLLEGVCLDVPICGNCGTPTKELVDAGPSGFWCPECDSEANHCWFEEGIQWVIVGGESGHGARPCNVAWVRSLMKQGRDAGVPVFVKQLGGHVIDDAVAFIDPSWPEGTKRVFPEDQPYTCRFDLDDPKGSDLDEWPEDLRVREMPAPEQKGGQDGD